MRLSYLNAGNIYSILKSGPSHIKTDKGVYCFITGRSRNNLI